MNIILGLEWNIVIHDVRDIVDMDPATGNISCDQDAALAFSKLIERQLAIRLPLVGVDRVGIINSARMERAPQAGCAILGAHEHDDAPLLAIDQAQKLRVLRLFLHHAQMLGHGRGRGTRPSDGHALGLMQDLPGQHFDGLRKSGRKQQGLPIFWNFVHDLRKLVGKPHVEHAVSLIENHDSNELKPDIAALQVVAKPSGRGHEVLGIGRKRRLIDLVVHSADQGCRAQAPGLSELFHHRVGLKRNFTRWRKDQDKGPFLARKPLDRGKHEGCRLARSGLGRSQKIAALEGKRNGFGLHWGRALVAGRQKLLHQGRREAKLGPRLFYGLGSRLGDIRNVLGRILGVQFGHDCLIDTLIYAPGHFPIQVFCGIPGPAMQAQSYVNLAFYKFVGLDELPQLRESLRAFCQARTLRGTILIAPEGINCTIAGTREAIDELRAHLDADPRFSALPYKESASADLPYSRMLVKIKKEIIAFGVPVDPAGDRAPAVTAHELKQWLDEGREVILLDTRNDYEVLSGRFKGAHELKIRTFRAFPDEARKLPEDWKSKTVVSYCTGGIRCEKAAPLLKQYGFEKIYQLEGGILRYFEEVGGAHYDGECFVFDYRVGVDPALAETPTAYCENCQFPVTDELQKLPTYRPGVSCPSCVGQG